MSETERPRNGKRLSGAADDMMASLKRANKEFDRALKWLTVAVWLLGIVTALQLLVFAVRFFVRAR